MAFGNYGYNNYFNPNYQIPYPTVPQQAQQNQNTGILWVQGEAGAKAYPVAPGASVLLMDSEAKTMYLKAADQSGMPTMRIFDYSERTSSVGDTISPTEQKYVTQEEFLKLVKAVKSMKEKMEVTADGQSDI